LNLHGMISTCYRLGCSPPEDNERRAWISVVRKAAMDGLGRHRHFSELSLYPPNV
jgi:hypothetical protein